MLNFWLAIIFFVLAYVFIVIEKVHRTVVVWIAAALLISLGVISQEKAVQNIDFNTLWLLIGMMVIVGITRKSGVFEYIAIKSAKIAKGRPVYLLIVRGLELQSIASAFLDNVTTVLLIVPVNLALPTVWIYRRYPSNCRDQCLPTLAERPPLSATRPIHDRQRHQPGFP
jgi:Na+/H+ antiporter NhaD/arsenite permease-like protein